MKVRLHRLVTGLDGQIPDGLSMTETTIQTQATGGVFRKNGRR